MFLGDIVGRIGRRATFEYLEKYKLNYDFIIANVENASHGFGLTEKNYKKDDINYDDIKEKNVYQKQFMNSSKEKMIILNI